MRMMSPVVRLTLCLSLAAAGFSSCKKNSSESASDESEKAGTPPPTVAMATPAPPPTEAAAAASAPATPPPQIAPPGVYFLLTAVTVATDAGVTGLKPGTRVVRQLDGSFLADGGHKLTLRPDQITNDLRIAGQAASADKAAQSAIRQSLAPPPSAATAGQPAAGAGTPRAAASATPARSRYRKPDPAELARQAKADALAKRASENTAQRERLQQELSKLSTQDPKKSPAAARINSQLNALDESDRKIDQESRNLR